MTGLRNIACVGGGTIGAGWAAVFLAAGRDVVMSDPAADGEAGARRIIDQAWPFLERLGLADGASRDRFDFVSSMEAAVRDAEFVQESAPDREDLKIALFEAMGAATPPDTVLASSSSQFLPTRLQSRCRHPERVVIGHPFAPSYLIPLVEVVGGKATSEEVMNQACAFYESVGKKALKLAREIDSYIANRLQHVVFEEAAALVAEGVCSYRDIDEAMTFGPGMRWAFAGPVTCYHLGGGKGGVRHMIDHFGWKRDSSAREELVAAVDAMYGHLSIDDLEHWRDKNLTALLQSLQPAPKRP